MRYYLNQSVRDVTADNSIDARELERADPSNYSNRPDAGLLPSMGDEYDSCGDDRPHFCSECGEIHTAGQSCGRALCPRDYAKWAVQRSKKVCAKMEETREQVAMRRGESPKFHHVVLSMKGIQFARDDPTDAIFELAKMILTDGLKVDGGYLIYHPYRGSDGGDEGEWKRRIGRDTEWNDVQDELDHEEHIHALVVADTVDYYTCEAIYEQTGVSVHRITKEDSNVSLYNLSDLARATTYSLSHANLEVSEDGSRVSSRYFGDVAQTSAGFQTEARADARVREIAGTTLGVSFSDLSCTRELGEEEEKVSHQAGAGSSGTEPSEPADSEADERVCGGRLLDITKAPKFLNDESWCEEADYVDELRRAWEDWKGPPD